MDHNDVETDLRQRVRRYIEIEDAALAKITIAVPDNSMLKDFADSAMTMIRSYFSDAKHFLEKNDPINAFAALNYSYGWIDSLVRLGVLDGHDDHRLFTLYR
ncbi:MAG: hypothetical protein AMDU1_APLC00020G0079 [Thermoplasmatales archaeon A-plasma]|jgi:hypothetical protein|nr:MAG: hypothetical protein AMDU1_APLC00020G0079 [Thermoplasmatales archaeon A-plasma]WMT44023.1 MAG: DUF357 domain-containing protein [Cuniculiplasma divulgatum]